jgi:hypothetical protein
MAIYHLYLREQVRGRQAEIDAIAAQVAMLRESIAGVSGEDDPPAPEPEPVPTETGPEAA